MTLSCPRCGAAHPRSRGENPALLAGRMKRAGSSPLARGKRPGREASHASIGLIPARAGKTTTTRATRSRSKAHPRSRGENAALSPSCTSVVGSSPLARGKRRSCQSGANERRLIPARAGKTLHGGPIRGDLQAHPRSRGENWGIWGRVHNSSGSSPLARGKPAISQSDGRVARLIPARAGKTSTASRWPTRRRGSSPLARGKLDVAQ